MSRVFAALIGQNRAKVVSFLYQVAKELLMSQGFRRAIGIEVYGREAMIGGKHVFQGEKKPTFSFWVIFFSFEN